MMKMRWQRATVALGMVLAAVACSESTGPEGDPNQAVISASYDLTLNVGQEVAVGGSVIKVSFTRVVEDSRCPMDVICVWAGNAVVELGIRAGMGPTFPIQLGTTLEPHSAEWNGVRMTLVELQPYPKASEPTRADAYTVKLRVEPAR